MIAGLDQPDTGEVLVNGEPVTGPGSDRGMVFQKYTSFPWLTVAGNIEYGMRINGRPDAERRKTVDHLIEAVGLPTGFANVYPTPFGRHAAARGYRPHAGRCARRWS